MHDFEDFDNHGYRRETRREQADRIKAGLHLESETDHPAEIERRQRETAAYLDWHDQYWGLVDTLPEERVTALLHKLTG